eukprot:Nitzschia sp. Nitz4//scaffold31_size150131//132990//135339//NITZ4_002853-RA/size150131-augustus-gene-0.9-mRNA-1//1//CDS//3329547734//1453//frame0
MLLMSHRVATKISRSNLRQVAVSALFASLATSHSFVFSCPISGSFHRGFALLSGVSGTSLPRSSTQHRFPVGPFLTDRITRTMATNAGDDSSSNPTSQSSKSSKDTLEALRARMKELNLDVYLVPSDDPHLSEYVPAAYMRRAFLSGFQGSAGTAVVFPDKALLWTDSRYWNEAGRQLDPDSWVLMKQLQPKVPTILKYLSQEAVKQYQETSKPLKVGIDPYVHPARFAKEFKEAMDEAATNDLNIPSSGTNNDQEDEKPVTIATLDTTHPNLIDSIWGEARPDIPKSPFRVHPLEYAGASIQEKVEKIRKQMQEKKATLAVFATLDDVAYLFNVRATGDVDTCPVGIAYATVSHDAVTLYCDPEKVQSSTVQEHLKGIVLRPYDQVVPDIKTYCDGNATPEKKVWLDASRSNFALSSAIPKRMLVDSQNAVTAMKACKNKAELAGMRQAHLVDGAAMAKFMAWLEHEVVVEGRGVSEVEVDEVLTSCRAEQPGFVECSFPTIAGVGSNAAIVHYRAKNDELMKTLDRTQPILIDSGGQYTYGTTDVTRTWHFGTPTDKFRDTYTRVLKGNIGVDTMVFPEGIPGFVLDAFARKSLWEAELDYGHGTGHGVGAALNVHEGPFGISPRFTNLEGLKSGMVVSNEPGYYEDGNFGIRIENLLEMKYVREEHDVAGGNSDDGVSSDKKYLKFSKLTMIPIQKNLINVDLMSDSELDWLDSYHQEVLSKVGPLLEPNSPALLWLQKSCTKIERQP